MKKLILIPILLITLSWADTGSQDSQKRQYKFIIGAGAGTEAGMGVHLGLLKGDNALQSGIGLLYGEDVDLFYSFGLRYLKYLTKGRFNNTYAWTGGCMTGNKNDSDHQRLASFGLGLGVDYHFRLPLHFQFDTGFRAAYDHDFYDNPEPGWLLGPTVNGSLTYHW